MISHSHNILLVEDHLDTSTVMARLLRRFGHHVHIANNCATARQLFAHDPTIDVLITDLGLPDGDGCDLFHQLQQIRKVPAIALTGHVMPQDRARTQAAGFIAHVAKPLDITTLEKTIASIKLTDPSPQQSAG